jgi:hypothetical protein
MSDPNAATASEAPSAVDLPDEALDLVEGGAAQVVNISFNENKYTTIRSG